MSKPLLLLDVDGVLCPFGDPHGFIPIPGHEYVVYAPAHTEALNRLSATYDLVWASMWEGDANLVLAPLHGLEPLPYIPFMGDLTFIDFYSRGPEEDTFKLRPVQKFVGDQAFAWIDDELHEDAFQWAKERNSQVPTKLVHTDKRVGLTIDQIEDLEVWPDTW